jgi:hypothetical protein
VGGEARRDGHTSFVVLLVAGADERPLVGGVFEVEEAVGVVGSPQSQELAQAQPRQRRGQEERLVIAAK